MFDRDKWLLEELSSRKEKDESFSLRSFAHEIDLSPATLSNVLRGKTSLSLKTAKAVLEKLGYETAQRMIILEIYKRHEDTVKLKKKRAHKLINSHFLPVDEIKYIDFDAAKELNFWEANYLYAKMLNLPKDLVCINERKEWLAQNSKISAQKIDLILSLYKKHKLINDNLICLYVGFDFHASAEDFKDLEFRAGFFKTHYEFQDSLVDFEVEKYPVSRWEMANLNLGTAMAFQSLIQDFYFNLNQVTLRENINPRKTFGLYICLRSIKFGDLK